MKKIITLFLVTILSISLASCNKKDEKNDDSDRFSNVIVFNHIDGYGLVDERDAYVLFEYRMRDYVKYQLAYVACTCRAAEVNFWKVAYVEIGTTNHELRKISFDVDGTGKYTAGFWGDSDPIPPYGNTDLALNEWITKAQFDEYFIPWLLGKTLSDFDGISIFTNGTYPNGHKNDRQIAEQDLVDMFVGASVTSNNMIRAMVALLEYHNANYNK